MLIRPTEAAHQSYNGVTLHDAGVIEKFADRLYARANWIVALYVMLAVLLAMPVAFLLQNTLHVALVSIAAAVGIVLIAIVLGQERAFQLRLQAQIALCQVQIEKNMRRDTTPQ